MVVGGTPVIMTGAFIFVILSTMTRFNFLTKTINLVVFVWYYCQQSFGFVTFAACAMVMNKSKTNDSRD